MSGGSWKEEASDLAASLMEVKDLESDGLRIQGESGGSLNWTFGSRGGVFSELKSLENLELEVDLCLEEMDLGSKLRREDVDILPTKRLSLLSVVDFMVSFSCWFLLLTSSSVQQQKERVLSAYCREREEKSSNVGQRGKGERTFC